MQELCSLMANCLRRSGVASCNGMAPTPLAQQVHERSTWNPPHTIGIDQRCRRLRSAIALRKWSRGVGVSSGSVPPLGSSRELPLTRTPRHVLIFAATSSAEGQVLEVKRTLVARTSQCPVPAGAAAEPLKPSVSSQPEAVCESTFRRACTALLTFPAYFRQNASTAFIRRRFSVVT